MLILDCVNYTLHFLNRVKNPIRKIRSLCNFVVLQHWLIAPQKGTMAIIFTYIIHFDYKTLFSTIYVQKNDV